MVPAHSGKVTREFGMRFDEDTEGDYRIYAGALEAPGGHGYTAALVVNRERGAAGAAHKRQEAFRDESLACGHRWPSSDEAISFALARGRELVRRRLPELRA